MVKSLSPGGVAERLKAHVLKTCLGHTNVGSNPTPSARLILSVVTALATVPVRLSECKKSLLQKMGRCQSG